MSRARFMADAVLRALQLIFLSSWLISPCPWPVLNLICLSPGSVERCSSWVVTCSLPASVLWCSCRAPTQPLLNQRLRVSNVSQGPQERVGYGTDQELCSGRRPHPDAGQRDQNAYHLFRLQRMTQAQVSELCASISTTATHWILGSFCKSMQ